VRTGKQIGSGYAILQWVETHWNKIAFERIAGSPFLNRSTVSFLKNTIIETPG